MATGRPPKHPVLRRLEGNPGKRVIPEMPVLPQAADAAPPDLIATAYDYWCRIWPSLVSAGMVTEVDREQFAACCRYYAEYRDPGSSWRRMNEAFDKWYKIARDFGLTPVDRVRLSKRPLKESPGSKWKAAL
jgi:phage terminase small subunit